MTTPSLPVINAHAAAIDVGSEQLHVSIAGGPPKVFGTTTGELHALRDYFLKEGVRTVAMEATGIYWLCPYEELEKAGLEVVMVNGKYVKNLPGRKTDISDCQWQATLHAHGLLKPGFVPPEHVRRLQDYLRLRSDHIVMAASHEQHMQKALERMNLKIHDVISDLTGFSGLKMIEAILGGERNPTALVALCDPQVQKRKADRLRAALEGTWRKEHLFALRQAHELWVAYQRRIAECDEAIGEVLKEMVGPEDPQAPAPPPQTKRGGVNAPQIAGLHGLLFRLCGGKDPTQLPGVADYVLLQLLAEVGTDLGRNWKSEKQFTAWLGVAPGSRQSGKRKGSQKRSRNRAGRLFCVVARTVGRSVDKALGGFYRRLKGRRGGLVANIALARKLAVLFWRLMVHGAAYVEQGLKKYEQRVAETEQGLLRKLAKKYNLVLQPKAA
ncbi:MAG: IS110 family transposase [Verrucomicrobiales bacterium]|nr:IS110 family transposase [Verrucomicrobiales bacterium]